MKALVNFLQEAEMLSHIPRSGFAFLGSGKQSVAEHSFTMTLVAHVLARLSTEPVNHSRLMLLCLFHDFPEARIGDLNYMQKRYVQANLEQALADIKDASPLGIEIVEIINEYEEGKTLEAQLAKDADQLELLLVLKKEQELGNPRAALWFENACKRLKTATAQKLATTILHTSTDEWWLSV